MVVGVEVITGVAVAGAVEAMVVGVVATLPGITHTTRTITRTPTVTVGVIRTTAITTTVTRRIRQLSIR